MHILRVTLIKLFIHSIVTVWMLIAFKTWMDTDAYVVFGAFEIFRVGAGTAAVVRVAAGVPAVVRIPVVSGVVIPHDVIKSVTVVFMPWVSIDPNISRADSLIVHLNIFVLCAGLINGKDPV